MPHRRDREQLAKGFRAQQAEGSEVVTVACTPLHPNCTSDLRAALL